MDPTLARMGHDKLVAIRKTLMDTLDETDIALSLDLENVSESESIMILEMLEKIEKGIQNNLPILRVGILLVSLTAQTEDDKERVEQMRAARKATA